MTRKTSPLGSDAAEWARAQAVADPEMAKHMEAEMARLALAAKVKRLRERRHLTQAELAERVGIAQPNIARLESGRVSPRADLLAKIAAALGARLELVTKRA